MKAEREGVNMMIMEEGEEEEEKLTVEEWKMKERKEQ